MRETIRRWAASMLLLVLAGSVLAGGVLTAAWSVSSASAQQGQRPIPIPVPNRIVPVPQPSPEESGAAKPASAPPRESVQADVSTRNVPVTSNFSGTEIVVFGAVNNSRQLSAEAGLYDIVIVVVGTRTRLVARRKSQVLGLWLNTDALAFESVPSYYAIASTRPVDEIASPEVLKSTGVGFDYVPMELAKSAEGRTAAEIRAFREAIVRLKRRERLYAEGDFAVTFIGPSLFRASIEVPANVVVGPFETRVHLFRNGELLDQYSANLKLERQGLEETMHVLAFERPLIYGFIMIGIATSAGLLAAAMFRGSGR